MSISSITVNGRLDMKDIHNCRNCTAVSLPHASESWLASKIPQFYCDISFGYLSHIESYSRNHILTKPTGLQKKTCLPMIQSSSILWVVPKGCLILTAMTFTSDVFPAFWSPIKESSISCLKKRLQIEESRKLLFKQSSPSRKNEWQIISVHPFAWKLEHVITK